MEFSYLFPELSDDEMINKRSSVNSNVSRLLESMSIYISTLTWVDTKVKIQEWTIKQEYSRDWYTHSNTNTVDWYTHSNTNSSIWGLKMLIRSMLKGLYNSNCIHIYGSEFE